ncbi:MAG: hypothetical protein E6Q93_16345 [Burkholderiaceae bacterium]|nr:MAG: hypothetical protein E6Q93_16345 [Burkholderiaceae bacterium]
MPCHRLQAALREARAQGDVGAQARHRLREVGGRRHDEAVAVVHEVVVGAACDDRCPAPPGIADLAPAHEVAGGEHHERARDESHRLLAGHVRAVVQPRAQALLQHRQHRPTFRIHRRADQQHLEVGHRLRRMAEVRAESPGALHPRQRADVDEPVDVTRVLRDRLRSGGRRGVRPGQVLQRAFAAEARALGRIGHVHHCRAVAQCATRACRRQRDQRRHAEVLAPVDQHRVGEEELRVHDQRRVERLRQCPPRGQIAAGGDEDDVGRELPGLRQDILGDAQRVLLVVEPADRERARVEALLRRPGAFEQVERRRKREHAQPAQRARLLPDHGHLVGFRMEAGIQRKHPDVAHVLSRRRTRGARIVGRPTGRVRDDSRVARHSPGAQRSVRAPRACV